jgi:signal transduction histidine kinase
MDDSNEKILHELLELAQCLRRGDYTKRVIMNVDGSLLSQICVHLNAFADQLQMIPFTKKSSNLPINEFIDVISSFTNRSFEKKLSVSEHSNFLDALATGINILGEELKYTTVTKNELEIERNNLKIAKEEAEEANRLKTIFLGNLSHEVRTPLQGILGLSELLESPGLTNENRVNYLQIIKQRSSDLQHIIESLLDMASLETGEIKPQPIELNLHETIDEIYNSFRDEHLSKKNRIELLNINAIPTDAYVCLDPVHLKRVVLNLLNNSIKFTNEGRVTLFSKRASKHFHVAVEDSGIGIAPDKLDQIFEPFRQAHEGLSREKGGLGLGLPICKKMAAIWGGSISVESILGKGSTFTVKIPASIKYSLS